MIHVVTDRKYRRLLAQLPLMASVLLLLAVALPPLRVVLERAAYRVVATQGYAPLGGAWQAPRMPRTPQPVQRLAPEVCTWTGARVVVAPVYDAPPFTLPRSDYGDATWNPRTDEVSWDAFPVETVFLGTLHAVTGGNGTAWNAAMAAAIDGDVIELRVTQTCGNATHDVVARAPGAGYVLVRDQATMGTIPAVGTRVTPAQLASANVMQTQTGYTGSTVRFLDNAQRYVFSGIRWLNNRTPGLEGVALVDMAPASTPANVTGYVAFRHCQFDGAWTLDPANRRICRRGISTTASYVRIADCDFRGLVSTTTDSNAVNTSSGVGKFVIDNCAMEAASETILWGGSTSARGSSVEVCADIRTTRCFFWRRDDWMTTAAEFAYSSQKNFVECKNAARWLIDRCVARGFTAQAQDYQTHFKAVAQSAPDGPIVTASDIQMRGCDFQGGRGGPTNIAHGKTEASKPLAVQGTRRINLHNTRWINQPDAVASSPKVSLTKLIVQPATVSFIPDVRMTALSMNTWQTNVDLSSAYAGSTANLHVRDCLFFTGVRYRGPRGSSAGEATVLDVSCGAGLYSVVRNVQQASSFVSTWGNAQLTADNAIAPTSNPVQVDAEGRCVDARYNTFATTGGPPGIVGSFLGGISGVGGSTAYSV